MKQMIVLMATIVLGICIAGLVIGFEDTARELVTVADGGLASVFTGAAIRP
jgi:hypothetical protein